MQRRSYHLILLNKWSEKRRIWSQLNVEPNDSWHAQASNINVKAYVVSNKGLLKLLRINQMTIWHGLKLELHESLLRYWFCLKIIIIPKIWFGHLLPFWYFMPFNVNDRASTLPLVRAIHLKFLTSISPINLTWSLVVPYKARFRIILYFTTLHAKMLFAYYINENVSWHLTKDLSAIAFIILYFSVNLCFN